MISRCICSPGYCQKFARRKFALVELKRERSYVSSHQWSSLNDEAGS